MSTIKSVILEAWSRCRNEHERGEVLGQIEAARREIRVEYLWAEPELRIALAELEGQLNAVMRSSLAFDRPGFGMAPVSLFTYENEGCETHARREAPLVGVAGHIAMLLAMRAEHKARMHAELRGYGSHACRIQDAIEAHPLHAYTGSGTTGYVKPADPLSVACIICKAKKGEKCEMVRRSEDKPKVEDKSR